MVTSCKKLVDVDAPVTSVNQENVYANDISAISVLTGIYTGMSSNSSVYTGINSVSLLSGLSSDELTLYSGVTDNKIISYFRNSLSATTNGATEFWGPFYTQIYRANAAIEGLSASTKLTAPVKQQLLGEAKFLRAFNYFYLVNLFGEVPLAMTTDYRVNTSMARSPKSDVYRQIIADLKEAADLLSADYVDGSLQAYSGSSERVRPTKWAATALLARVYLSIQDWSKAESEATAVINNKLLFDTVSLNNVFLKNSNEAIWQLQPVMSGHNTEDGWIFILPSGPNSSISTSSGHPVYLSSFLLNSFEPSDFRSQNGNWIKTVVSNGTTYAYPFKYKSRTLNAQVTEYLMVLRLAEQYLIRAEARAHLNKLPEAISDLDMIRNRARLPLIASTNPGISQSALIDKIFHERQVELFTEWGHRWLDLKRTGNIDAVMNAVTPQKANGSLWRSFQQLYPLPLTEIQRNPALIQNPGY
jgi:hypothetical protein